MKIKWSQNLPRVNQATDRIDRVLRKHQVEKSFKFTPKYLSYSSVSKDKLNPLS